MLITTTDTLPGHEILSILGVVEGSSLWIAKAITKQESFLGTKIKVDAEELADSHQYRSVDSINDAMQEIQKNAEELSADAVVGLRVCPIRGSEFTIGRAIGSGTKNVTDAAVVMYVYGTAVRTRRLAKVVAAVNG